MGIHDRDYYRDESGPWWSSLSGHRATWWIIGVTVGVWVAQVVLSAPGAGQRGGGADPILPLAALTPNGLGDGEVWRVVTCHFVHSPDALLAVVLGMLFLYWFGTGLEELYGSRELIGFYLTTGLLIAAGKEVEWVARGVDPDRVAYFGAAGVLSGILVLYAFHFPHRQILFMFVIPMPVWLLAALLVGLSIIGLSGGARGPIPHLIAAGFAFAYFRLQFRLTAWMPAFASAVSGRRRSNLRLYAPTRPAEEESVAVQTPVAPVAIAQSRAASLDEQLEAKLDRVLEKVAREGRENLSDEERAILLRASEVFKNRRR